ncbi:lytic transglycosylase domain-containing protein [Nitratireductor kimnyeongensis]|uniref:Lytic transglycosylase domain-containing protein n=1 Tax=Nitratireductor kimnyeongensis TaxID=430679 RepID=A0ABW0TBV1_9HYPH|nr:lytic transglycosylase domain-containing protein [Nitratireductor kimnyeongensis]QZZ36896.1 lytic transglycosylase domain-containing protein [Nitratireductor kimnyeongensis]
MRYPHPCRQFAFCAFLGLFLLRVSFVNAEEASGETDKARLVASICQLVEVNARENLLDPAFLARLLWKESRFNPNAVSPKGAEGVAQFMPGTAALRGLDDAFDIEKAIPASAMYLAELEKKFGNLGLAAAAYNAGEGRVSRWLEKGGFLPLETENYVMAILGAPADTFSNREVVIDVEPLHPEKSFEAACRELPVSARAVIAMNSAHTQPWGVQVAGHFRRDVAIRLWQMVLRRHATVLRGYEPVITRVRSSRGSRGIYAVRIGADSRAEAIKVCSRFRSGGLPCVVLRNK